MSELTRIFNSAIVSTRGERKRDYANELYELMETPAFAAILNAVRSHARSEGLSERQAAEQIIRTFRKVEEVLSDYVFQEGVYRLGGK